MGDEVREGYCVLGYCSYGDAIIVNQCENSEKECFEGVS